MKEKILKYNEKDSTAAYLFAILMPVLLSLFFYFVVALVSYSSEEIAKAFASHISTIVVFNFLGYVLYATFLYVYHKKKNVCPISAMQLKGKISVRDCLIAIALALVTLFGFLLLINFLTDALKLTGFEVNTDLPLPLHNFGWFLVNVLMIAILPAFFEEIIYRGMILSGLRKFGDKFAIISSAVLFSLAHGSPVQTIYQFILGIIFGIILVKTGSVFLCMITHFVNNFTVVFISYIQTISGAESVSRTVFDYSALEIVLAFVFAILSGFAVYFIVKGFHKSKKEQLYYKEENAKFDVHSKIILIITIACAVVMWVTSIF